MNRAAAEIIPRPLGFIRRNAAATAVLCLLKTAGLSPEQIEPDCDVHGSSGVPDQAASAVSGLQGQREVHRAVGRRLRHSVVRDVWFRLTPHESMTDEERSRSLCGCSGTHSSPSMHASNFGKHCCSHSANVAYFAGGQVYSSLLSSQCWHLKNLRRGCR